MLKKIESLRSKPKEVRNRYAFWYAFGFTGLIFIFWLVGVPSRVGILTSAQPEANVEVEGGVSRSFSDLRASVADGLNLFNRIKEGPETVESESTETQEKNIDFTSFMSTSSAPVPVLQKSRRAVLIGTTSQSQSTSTGN